MLNLLKIFMKNRLRLVIEALKEERKVFSDSDFADMIGKSKSFLSDMLSGHSDYNAMKPYIDVTDTAKAEAMKVFDR